MINPIDSRGYLDDMLSASHFVQHSNNSIVFDTLLHDDFDWGQNEWTSNTMSKKTLDTIRGRINSKIINQYRFREIGGIPGRFRIYMIRELTNAATQYGYVYEKLVKGLDIYKGKLSTNEELLVHSEFPQATLNSEKEDYATTSDMKNSSSLEESNNMEALLSYMANFNEPDIQLVKSCEKNFSILNNFTY